MTGATNEEAIRAALATRLGLLEKGLMLVDQEYRLPNRVGATGRIDILARDRTGCLVVIELKRTDSAARTALHELAKYVELLQREKGIGPADVRAMIVAVQWRELLVPFSRVARTAQGGLVGYQLILDADMVTPVAAQRIAPLEEAAEPMLSEHQLFIQSKSRSLDDAWTWATSRFGSLGIADLVGFEFSHTTYAPGLYLALATRRPGDATAAMERWGTAPHGFTVEDVNPHSLISLQSDNSWTLTDIHRHGVYTDATLFRDEDLAAEAAGGGLSDIIYIGKANSSYTPRWSRFRSRVRRSLSGNDSWTAEVERWLDEATDRGSEADLLTQIYNPCDLAAAICFGWPDRLSDLVPRLTFAGSINGEPCLLEGVLIASNLGHDANSAFDLAYGGVDGWFQAHINGEAWAFDGEFLRGLGLRYALFARNCEGERELLEWRKGELVGHPPDSHQNGAPVWHGIQPLPAWARANSAVIDTLATRMRIAVDVNGVQRYR